MMSSQRPQMRQRGMSGNCRQRHSSAATLERDAPRGTIQDEMTEEMMNRLMQVRGLERLTAALKESDGIRRAPDEEMRA